MTILQLAFALLAIASLPSGQAPRHFRQHRLGAEGRAVQLAEFYMEAAAEHGVPADALVALGRAETNFNRRLVSSVGAMSIMQLHPAYQWGRAYRATWRMGRDERDRVAINLGADAMRHGFQVCHTLAGAIAWYRSGTCKVGKRALAVIALRRKLLHYSGV